jgi:GNAT superfamily N-acetyltransferase
MLQPGAFTKPEAWSPEPSCMSIDVRPVRSRADLRDFVRLPWQIYRGDRDWVPPLVSDVEQAVDFAALGRAAGTHEVFVARRAGRAVGRIYAAFDPVLNKQKRQNAGHLSLFESVNDVDAARALFDRALAWLKERGVRLVRGPVCPSGPAIDEHKGVLLDGFDGPPIVLTSYNPPYYPRLFEQSGFEKDADVFAYHLDAARLFAKDPARAVRYAERRYGFRTDPMNTREVEAEVRAIKHVLDLAVPAEWVDMVPPSLEEVREMATRLVPLVDPDLTAIVRAGDEPVGFGLAIPDYNQVLIHLNGRITPLGALKYLWYKRRISRVRVFIMFVVPAFRQKGVAHAIYYRIFDRGTAKGYTQGEASTIGETNRQMRTDIEKMGGEKYRTYRVYGKTL